MSNFFIAINLAFHLQFRHRHPFLLFARWNYINPTLVSVCSQHVAVRKFSSEVIEGSDRHPQFQAVCDSILIADVFGLFKFSNSVFVKNLGTQN